MNTSNRACCSSCKVPGRCRGSYGRSRTVRVLATASLDEGQKASVRGIIIDEVREANRELVKLLEQRFGQVEKRFDKLEKRCENIEQNIDELWGDNERTESNLQKYFLAVLLLVPAVTNGAQAVWPVVGRFLGS